VTLCSLVYRKPAFRTKVIFPFSGHNIISILLIKRAGCFSETSLTIYHIAWRHSPINKTWRSQWSQNINATRWADSAPVVSIPTDPKTPNQAVNDPTSTRNLILKDTDMTASHDVLSWFSWINEIPCYKRQNENQEQIPSPYIKTNASRYEPASRVKRTEYLLWSSGCLGFDSAHEVTLSWWRLWFRPKVPLPPTEILAKWSPHNDNTKICKSLIDFCP
jgi:hypothetical protein